MKQHTTEAISIFRQDACRDESATIRNVASVVREQPADLEFTLASKTQKGAGSSYSTEALAKSVKDVKNENKTVLGAALFYNIPRSTVQHHVFGTRRKGHISQDQSSGGGRVTCYLFAADEEELTNGIRFIEKVGLACLPKVEHLILKNFCWTLLKITSKPLKIKRKRLSTPKKEKKALLGKEEKRKKEKYLQENKRKEIKKSLTKAMKIKENPKTSVEVDKSSTDSDTFSIQESDKVYQEVS
ncbi:hypothetical protein J6590_005352 [Homalodisca vitripennis]|nr:hypothetical protein J6590_005352 [Homalodisca vitripennis]